MNRDALKTIGAVALIAIIVGATFWYGNKQRQEQIKSDQTVKQQQQKSKTVASGTSTPTPAPAVATPTPQPVMPAATPQTGAETTVLIPLGALVAAAAVKRASDRSLSRALRSV